MKSSLSRLFVKVTTFLIVGSLVNLLMPSTGVMASTRRGTVATGIVRVSGSVTINGVKGTSGQTILRSSHIVTSADSESIIDLEKLTRLRLLAETDFRLDFSSESIWSTLGKGAVRGFIPAGIPVSIKTAGGELRTDPTQASEFIVHVDDENTRLSVMMGRVEFRTEESLKAISGGETFTTFSGSQTDPDEDEGLTDRQKVGIFAAIGAAAAILIIVLRGREKKEEPEFGGCPIVPSGTTGQTGICP